MLRVTEVRLEPMTEEQYRAYLQFAEEDYAGNAQRVGFNAGAQSLYEQMGFEVTAIQMSMRP